MKPENAFLTDTFRQTAKRLPMQTILLFLSVATGALISVWPSLILKRIVDGPLTHAGVGLWSLAFLYLGAMMLIGANDLVRQYCSTVFGQRALLHIRTQMLSRLRLLPISYYLQTPSGETMSRFTADIDAVNTLFTSGVINALADLFKIAGLLVVLFTLSVSFGIVAVCAFPLLYIVTDFFRKRIYERQLEVRKRVSDINTGILETYAGMKIIKIFGKERFFANRFEPLLESHREAMNANSIYDAWYPCITQTIRAVVIAIALFIGAKSNLTPWALGLSLGTLAAGADLFIRLFTPIEAVSNEIQTIQRAFAGIARVKAYFSQPVEEKRHIGDIQTNLVDTTVVIQNVRFAYQDGHDVLSGATLTIPIGTKAAIAGRTGSGKTTLMNLVAGLYEPKSGSITVGGLNPYLLPPEARRRLIGIVPQNVVIFNGTILENVTLRDESISREQAERALHTAGLYDAVQLLPEGIDTVLGEGAQKLSFGQTQLLSLARAIVTDPPLLLLDELTSGLDAITERAVLDAITAISGKKTILTISHRLSGIIDADTVHIMERGRIMESGSPQELMQKEGWYSRYKRLEDLNWRIS